MGRLGFTLGEALRALAARPVSALLAVGSVALTLLMAGTVWILGSRLGESTSRWANGVVAAVYLDPTADESARARVAAALHRLPGVSEVRYVDQAEALHRLQSSVGPDAEAVADIPAEWLPPSYEVALRGPRQVLAQAQERLAALGQALDAITEVRTVRSWTERVEALATALNRLAVGLAILALAICVYVVASTVRLGLLQRGPQLAVQRLLGAPRWVLVAPGLLEGLFVALLGGLVALGLLAGLLVLFGPELSLLDSRSFAEGLGGLLRLRIVGAGLGLVAVAGMLGACLGTVRGGVVS